MANDNNKQKKPDQKEKYKNAKSDQNLNVKNPFNENDNKVMTRQDVEGEQDFKEAQTERD